MCHAKILTGGTYNRRLPRLRYKDEEVISMCSSDTMDMLQSLGANIVIDYKMVLT